MRGLQISLNHTQKIRLQRAREKLESLSSKANSDASVIVADTIPLNYEDGVLKGHGTLDLNGEVVATICGVVERVNKLIYVRALRARYKPEVGDIVVGRVTEVAPKRWRLDINYSQDAVLMLSSMNLPDGIQRRRTAVDELNMRSIFEENDVICAEVRGLQHDGLHLQARSQKYGKLERGQMLTVSPYLVKRRKQHFHHLEQYGIDLILGCNGFIWIGEHVDPKEDMMIEDQVNISEQKGSKFEGTFGNQVQERVYTPLTSIIGISGIMAGKTSLMVRLLLALALYWAAVHGKKKGGVTLLKGEEKIAALNGRLRDGVVEFTTETYTQLVLRPDRPYHMIMLYTAMADKYSCDVCKTVHPEFHTLAESYLAAKQIKVDTRDGLDVFFGVVDFDQNQQIFGVYGFTSAPHIVYIGPDHSADEGQRIPSKVEIPMQNTYSVYQSGKKAEDIVDFVKQKTGSEFVIQRSKAFMYAAVVSLLVLAIIAAKIILSNLDKVLAKLRRKRLWMTVSLLFYGLSVSGMVYCIIREPPAYSTERNGNIKFFHPAGRSQFVVEGLIVGAFDVIAAGCVILLSQWAIYIQRPVLRYTATFVCMAGFVVMYRQMIGAYKFKNRWYQGWMGF